jgi:cytochrome c-type biogenesis protein
MFAVGILITIAAIGLITASLGRMMGDIGRIGNYLVAIVFVIVGFYLLDVIKLDWGGFSSGGVTQKGWLAPLILGLLFGIGLGPCTFAYMAPMLGVVFQVASTQLFFAIALLTAFGIGHCLVIVLAGTLTERVQQYLNWTEKTKGAIILRKACGVLVILSGIYLLFK